VGRISRARFDRRGPLWQDRRDDTPLIRAVRHAGARIVLVLAILPALLKPDTYAFILGETGLITGVGRQGWKIIKAGP